MIFMVNFRGFVALQLNNVSLLSEARLARGAGTKRLSRIDLRRHVGYIYHNILQNLPRNGNRNDTMLTRNIVKGCYIFDRISGFLEVNLYKDKKHNTTYMQQKFLFIEITNVCKNHKLRSNVRLKTLKRMRMLYPHS